MIMVLLLSGGCFSTLNGQERDTMACPVAAFKTNALGLAAGVANLGAEIRIAEQFSLHLPVRYSPYTITENHRLRMLTLQPEVRYWLSKTFSGHFFGLHPIGSFFNISFHSETRYQTNRMAFGAGASYGYSMNLGEGSDWRMEFALGAGYVNMAFDKYYNVPNGILFGSGHCHYFGLTHASVSIVYLINRRERR